MHLQKCFVEYKKISQNNFLNAQINIDPNLYTIASEMLYSTVSAVPNFVEIFVVPVHQWTQPINQL